MIVTARAIVAAAEGRVLGAVSTPWPWLDGLARGLFLPWMLLARGLKDLGGRILRILGGAVAGALLGLVMPMTAQASRSANVVSLVALGALVALMSAPSDLCQMIDSAAVQAVAQILRDQGVHCLAQCDALTDAVALLERRPRSRIAALKWILTTTWAVTVFAFAQTLTTPPADEVVFHGYVELGAWALVVAAAVYVLVTVYASPVDLVFESVYLGLAQHRYELADAES